MRLTVVKALHNGPCGGREGTGLCKTLPFIRFVAWQPMLALDPRLDAVSTW